MMKILLIDKPQGLTSHDVIDRVRQVFGVKKVGHAGTLDPFATGLLLVAVGREATRQLGKLAKLDKEYLATIRLGAESTTGDTEGKVMTNDQCQRPNIKEIERVLQQFSGEQRQIPPMFSAKKIKGRKLYQLARQGKEIKREPVKVEVKELEMLRFQWPDLKIRALVSAGTYLRVLAQDIGKVLGVGGYLTGLRRTKIGRYGVEQAVSLGEIKA